MFKFFGSKPKYFTFCISLFVMSSIPSISFADLIEGKMSCEISQISKVETDDGKPIEIGYFKKLLGQKFTLTYTFWGKGYAEKQMSIKVESTSFLPSLLFAVFDSQTFKFYEEPQRIIYDGDPTIWFDKDLITATSSPIQHRSLTMKRYYKSDWEGVLTYNESNNFTSVKSIGFDCRHITDRVFEIIDYAKTNFN